MEDGEDDTGVRFSRGVTLEHAQNLRRDRELEELGVRMEEMMWLLEHGRGGDQRNNTPSLVRSSRNTNHDSSSEDEGLPRNRRQPRDDDRGLRLDMPEFD